MGLKSVFVKGFCCLNNSASMGDLKNTRKGCFILKHNEKLAILELSFLGKCFSKIAHLFGKEKQFAQWTVRGRSLGSKVVKEIKPEDIAKINDTFEQASFLSTVQSTAQAGLSVLNSSTSFVNDSSSFTEPSAEDLQLLLRSWKGHEVSVDGTDYTVFRRKSEGIFSIQEKGEYRCGSQDKKISIKIEDGVITNLCLGPVTQSSTDIPTEWHAVFTQCLEAARSAKEAASIDASDSASPPSTTPPISSVAVPPPVEEQPKPQFSATRLKLFANLLNPPTGSPAGFQKYTAERPLDVEVDSTRYKVWYNAAFDAINIQDKEHFDQRGQQGKLGVNINPTTGKITSVWVDGTDKSTTEIPEDKVKLLLRCFEETTKKTSKYSTAFDSLVSSTVVASTVKLDPVYHLRQMGEQLRDLKQSPTITVSYLQNDLRPQAGIDAGGLTREYFGELFSGLVESPYFATEKEAGLPNGFPRRLKGAGQEKLSTKDQDVFENLGRVFMLAYLSPKTYAGNIALGKKLDHSLFKLFFLFQAGQLEKDFSTLTPEEMLPLLEAVNALPGTGSPEESRKTVRDLIAWYRQGETLDSDGKTGVDKAIEYLKDILMTIDEGDLEGKTDAQKKKLVFDKILESCNPEMLAPIHAIAKGMKSHVGGEHWNAHREENELSFVTFSEKVQGSLDREEVAGKIFYDQHHNPLVSAALDKRKQWLQAWVREETTPLKDVEKFLVWMTGTPGITSGAQLKLEAKEVDPTNSQSLLPHAHTCFKSVHLPVHFTGDTTTKEEFLASIHIEIQKPGGYTQG